MIYVMAGQGMTRRSIRERYEALTFDQKEFAFLVGMHADTLRAVENGEASAKSTRTVLDKLNELEVEQAEAALRKARGEMRMAQLSFEAALASGDEEAVRQKRAELSLVEQLLAMALVAADSAGGSSQADTPDVSDPSANLPDVATDGGRGEEWMPGEKEAVMEYLTGQQAAIEKLMKMLGDAGAASPPPASD